MSLLQNGVIGVLAFIFILGAAVILHEFGHFIVAKLFKIRVETFSVGFGPRLAGFKWGPTDYRISAIPLGGYVKLGGDESNAPIEGEGAVDIPAHERFDLRPRWQKISVALAGPVMNVLTALTIPLVAALMYGVPVMPAPVVSAVFPNSGAQQAGLQPGDRIVSFNGTEKPDWETIADDMLISPEQSLPMEIERNGQRVQLSVKPTTVTRDGDAAGEPGFVPDYGDKVVIGIGEVTPGSAAAEAGLQPGDQVRQIGGQHVRSSEQVIQYIRSHKTEPIVIQIERQGQPLEIAAKLKPGENILGVKIGQQFPMEKAGPITAARYAVSYNVRIVRVTGKALGQFFTGKRSARNTVSGPIGIYRVASSQAINFGWAGVIGTLGFLSLNLGIFNLLPIPVLDGGAIFLLLVEAVLGLVGVGISVKVRERIQQVGFVVVILLMVFVLTNDVLKTFSIWGGSNSSPPAAATPAK